MESYTTTKHNKKSIWGHSYKYSLSVLFSILMTVLWSGNVKAQEYLRVYTSKPGQMTSDVTGGTKATETFNNFKANDYHWAPLPSGYHSAIGNYYQTSGGSFIEADNQYGAGTGNYMAVEVGGKVDLVFNKPVTYFGFAWPAGDGQNTITIYRKGQVIGTFNTADVIKMLPNNNHNYIKAIDGSKYRTSDFYGKPGTGQDAGEPFAYLHFVASSGMAFDKVEFTMGQGGNFENDNHTILTSGTPQPQGSWVQIISKTTPTAVDDNGSGMPGQSVTVDVLKNDKKGDGNIIPSTVQISGTNEAGASLTVAGQGVWSVNTKNGDITFTPDKSLVGSPTPIQYFVRDDNDFASNLATCTITYPVGPTAKNDSITAIQGKAATLDILKNDVKGDTDIVPSTVQISGTNAPLASLTVKNQGVWSVDKTSGAITFTPDPSLTGNPTPIKYSVKDKNDIVSNLATVKVTYLTGPTAVNDSITGTPGKAVTLHILNNDVKISADINPATVQISGTNAPLASLTVKNEGVWSIDKTSGAITFTPDPSLTGSPTPIKYSVKDKNGITSNLATVKVTYLTGPTAVNDSITGTPGKAVTLDILKNDVKGSADINPATVQISGTNAPLASLTVKNEGVWSVDKTTGAITFTPDPSLTGSPTPIKYSVKDKNGIASNLATVKVTYPSGPVAVNDQAMTEMNHPVAIPVLDNDVAGAAALDPSTLTLVSGTQPDPSKVGTFTVDASNSRIIFTPVNGFTGTATVQYRITDKNNLSATATVTVNVVIGTTNYYPASGFGTLAYEDLWPYKGDYDFNDMVIDYQFKVNTNTSNYLESVEGTFILKAFGAYYQNGFGFQLSKAINQNDITVTGYQLKENIINLNSNGTEAGQANSTIIVFDNDYKLMPPQGGIGDNTTPSEPYITPDTIHITITFKPNTYTYNDLDIADFNPFIFVNQDRTVEVHLPGYAPTSLANTSLFGTGDDDSNPAAGRYYETKNNLPWAINLYSSFAYPVEKVAIVNAYLKFAAWAQSGGTEYQDWYKDLSGYRDNGNIYVVPVK
ncbi:MAG: LruC domain-containing protein [Bacteroidales bacterium]|nr:LruC domain-containing protein [Bacteroidales bacterium]